MRKRLKYLERNKKNIVYSTLYTKIINFIINILSKARNLGYYSIIKGFYHFLSILNIILMAFVLGFFSDANFNLDIPILTMIGTGLLSLVPSIILDYLTDFFINCASNVKTTIKRFISWVYGDDSYKPKIKKWRKDVVDPFSNLNQSTTNQSFNDSISNTNSKKPLNLVDMDSVSDNGGGLGRGNKGDVPKYVVIIILTIVTIGVTYYIFPDLYYTGYVYIKDKLSSKKPDPGSGDRRADGSLIVNYKPYKGKGVADASSHVGEVVVPSEEVLETVTNPSKTLGEVSKPMFGPERPPTFNSIVASGSMAESEVTLRRRLATILCSDMPEGVKLSKFDSLVQLLKFEASPTTTSDINKIAADVMSEYNKTQLTPKPGNIVLEAISRTPSFANTSWSAPKPTTPIKTTVVPPFDPKTSGFK